MRAATDKVVAVGTEDHAAGAARFRHGRPPIEDDHWHDDARPTHPRRGPMARNTTQEYDDPATDE